MKRSNDAGIWIPDPYSYVSNPTPLPPPKCQETNSKTTWNSLRRKFAKMLKRLGE